jgi:O-antigen ligase
VGSGGFRSHAAQLGQQRSDLLYGGPEPAHPHNMYLLALVRWGPAGLIALLVWLGVWIRTGWLEDWRASDAGILIGLPAIALAVHGLSAPSLEEHFPGVLAAILTGLGLSGMRMASPSAGERISEARR